MGGLRLILEAGIHAVGVPQVLPLNAWPRSTTGGSSSYSRPDCAQLCNGSRGDDETGCQKPPSISAMWKSSKHHDQKLDAPSWYSSLDRPDDHEVGRPIKQGHPDEKELWLPSGAATWKVSIHSLRLPGYVASQEVIFGSQEKPRLSTTR